MHSQLPGPRTQNKTKQQKRFQPLKTSANEYRFILEFVNSVMSAGQATAAACQAATILHLAPHLVPFLVAQDTMRLSNTCHMLSHILCYLAELELGA